MVKLTSFVLALIIFGSVIAGSYNWLSKPRLTIDWRCDNQKEYYCFVEE